MVHAAHALPIFGVRGLNSGFDDADFENCDGPYAGDGEGWDPENSTGEGTFDLYSGTQNSVNTFFAQLVLQDERGGRTAIVDARPSDAVALALRASCPMRTSTESRSGNSKRTRNGSKRTSRAIGSPGAR